MIGQNWKVTVGKQRMPRFLGGGVISMTLQGQFWSRPFSFFLHTIIILILVFIFISACFYSTTIIKYNYLFLIQFIILPTISKNNGSAANQKINGCSIIKYKPPPTIKINKNIPPLIFTTSTKLYNNRCVIKRTVR